MALDVRPIPEFEWEAASLLKLQSDTSPSCPSGDWYDIRFHVLTLYSIARHINWRSPQWPGPNSPPKCIEIGTREGPSTLALLTAMSETGGTLTSIECEQTAADLTRGVVEMAKLDPWWELLVGRSEDLVGHFADECADVILVDGDHSEAQVRKEIGLYGPKLRRGGFMLFHDYYSDPACLSDPISPPYPSGVSAPVEELRATGEYEVLIMPWAYGLAVCRRK